MGEDVVVAKRIKSTNNINSRDQFVWSSAEYQLTEKRGWRDRRFNEDKDSIPSCTTIFS
jgi:hypothetical protein